MTSEQPLFYTAKTIVPKDRSKIVSIRTGLTKIDKKIIGLNKQEVSCFSGSSGSGKSSIISQIALQVVNDGRKVAFFSGELSSNRVLEWLQLQAAGKDYTTATQYENYFYVKDSVKMLINEWLDQKLFVYNNNHGNKVEHVLSSIEDCIVNKKCDLVLLDNLMAMDITSLARDKLEREKVFVLSLMDFAKKGNVHVGFVAHPKKTEGFIRKTDISGNSDLTNAPDNVFIVHRVNEDFKRLAGLYFGWNKGDQIFNYDNVIEICKNRDLGEMDYLAGLYFEKQSKRFTCEKDEYRKYGWDTTISERQYDLPFDV